MIGDGGIGTYLRNVVPRLANNHDDWTFTALGDPDRLEAAGWSALPNMTVRAVRAPIYSVREQIEIRANCPGDADLYWAPHYNIPLLLTKPVAVTVHDVCHLALPETLGTMRRAYARAMFATVRRRAAVVFFDSEFSRAEMGRFVGEPTGAAAVVHLAADDDWYSVKERWPERPMREPYVVYVGNHKRHKNLPMLMRAFGDTLGRIAHTLVVIGRNEGLRGDPGVKTEAARLGTRVVITGELPRDRMQQYVAHADACVTASLYEGFGLPALEAMAAGTPCLVSTAGSLPEICSDAALYCDPRDRASIASALERIVGDSALRSRLARCGRERARQFTWGRSATQVARAFAQVLQ
jgi:glycosyltransferase involved in cell wall biosynthesis